MDLHFREWDFESPEYIPTLTFLKKLKEHTSSISGIIERLDFSGLQLLTDEVFFGLQTLQSDKILKDFLVNVVDIDLTGCVNITDIGLAVISKIFPALKKLNLDGCRKITEKGILSVAPGDLELSVVGCNGIRAPLSCIKANQDVGSISERPEMGCKKLVIVSDEVWKYSLLRFLCGEEQVSRSKCEDVLHRKAVSQPAEDQYPTHFNAFETLTFNNLTGPVLSDKAVYVLACPCNKDLLIKIMTAMNAVKGLEAAPEFVIVLLHNSASQMDEDSAGVGIDKTIKERLEVQNTALSLQLEEERFDSPLVKTGDFQSQLRMSRSMALKDKSTEEVRFSIFRLNIDSSMVQLQYQSHNISSEDDEERRKRDIEELQKSIEAKLEEFRPTYERALGSLSGLNKSDITELKSFATPPLVVLQVMKGLLLLFGKTDRSWKAAKSFLGNVNIIGQMLDYNLDTALTPKVVKDLKEYMERVDLSHEKIRSISSACSSFWLWISALYQYSVDIIPPRERLVTLQEAKDNPAATPKVSQSDRTNQDELYKKQEELKKHMEEAKASKHQLDEILKKIKKSDVTEMKQFKNPPAVVSEVLGAVAIILNVKPKKAGNYWPEMMQLIAKLDFLKTLQGSADNLSNLTMKRLHIYMDNVTLTNEQISKVSSACASLWSWVQAVYDYNKNIGKIKENITDTEMQIKEYETVLERDVVAQKGPGLLWTHLESVGSSLCDREPVLRSEAWTEDTEKVWTAILKLREEGTRACYRLTVQSKLGDDVKDQQLSAALERFHYQGHIFYHPDLQGQPVILDVAWYVQCLNDTLVSDIGHPNKHRCVALPSKTPLLIKEKFYKLWDCLEKEQEGEVVLRVLQHTGILVDVPRLAEDENRNRDLMYVNKYLGVKPALRILSGEDHISYSNFKREMWPGRRLSNYLEGDLSVGYNYVLNYGLPPSLFTQLLAECIKMGQVLLVWATGFTMRCGAVDISIQQHVHAFNLSASIELNARTNRILDGASPQVLQDYMWSTVNPYLLVVDYFMDHYKLGHKMRILCQGGCSLTELGHFFSSVELRQEHKYQLKCTLCEDQQMSLNTCGYLTGKRGLLPLHDFMDPEEKDIQVGENSPYGRLWTRETREGDSQLVWVCGHCGISKQAANHLWKMQCTVYPIPDSLSFSRSHRAGYSLYHTKKMPIYLQGLLDLHVTLIKDTQVKFVVARGEYFADGLIFDDLAKLKHSRLVYDFKTGVLQQIQEAGTKKKRKETLECIAVGDRFSVEANASMLEEMSSIDETWVMIELSLKKNGRELRRLTVPYRSFVGVLVESASAKATCGPEEGVVLECPTFPYVQASHFPLGQAVFYKTGLGNQWGLATVHCTEQGRLSLQSEKGEMLTPRPEDVLPVGLYSDITVTIGGEVLRNQEHIVDYLLSHNWEAVPYGLFVDLYHRRGTYSTVYLRRHHMPKICTWKSNSPAALEQLFNKWVHSEGKAGKFTPPQYHVLLPHGLTHKHLVHATRQVLHDWDKQNVHFLCKGAQWVTYQSHFKDMHLLSQGPALEEAVKLCTKLRGCQKTSRQNKKKTAGEDEEESDDNDTDCKVHLHAGDQMQLAMAYHFMLKNKNCLPDVQKKTLIFQEDETDAILSEREVAGLYRVFSMYKDTFMLLDRVLEVAYNYNFTKLHTSYRRFNRYLIKLYKQTVLGTERKQSKSCKAHEMLAKKTNFTAAASQQESSEDPFGFQTNLDGYSGCITFVNVTGVGPIGKFFKQFLAFLPNLRGLALMKCNLKSIEGVEQCRRLVYLDVSSNHIPEVLSESLQPLAGTLEVLNLSSNPLTEFPPIITALTKLRQLLIGDTFITRLPDDLGQLTNLRVLNLKVTQVTELPSSIVKCKMIQFLNLQGVPWLGRMDNVSTFDQLKKWAESYMATKNLPLMEMFDEANVTKDLLLSEDEKEILNQRLIKTFPRIGANKPEDDEYGGIPMEIFSLRNLRTLALGGQLIHKIPDDIAKLRRLQHLLLFYNPNLQGVSGQLGKANMQTLSLGGCPKCKTPPQEIIEKGMKVVLAYLKKLAQGSMACNRTKLMFVGLGGAGKTSLTRALMSRSHKAPVLSTEAITDGIDISTWTVKQENTTLQYSVWDFAGQTVYYNTHQFFLSNRALYLLVWNTRLGYEHSGLDFWLSSIACHCPRAPVFVVGTHADQITKTELPKAALKEKHPKIAGFFTVSSVSGLGVRELYEKILEVTLQQPYMGEMIPESWLSFEKVLMQKRGKESLLEWNDLMFHAHSVGIYGEEVLQSVRFLHELGTLQHFENDFLKDKVVINPQWIIDVMACVVSVHNKVIVDGHLDHKDISVIWKNYPENIHEWLLRLTEVFDLTFALSEKPVSVVPCLLPQEAPEYHWPRVDELEGARETKILYTFDYLPSGLCNRAQVRLCQFSDTSKMWKMGSVLVKNGHYALIQQISPTRVMVKVIGQRPENILLLIHEVFESLISDFFQGVKYEYQIPCPDCIEAKTEGPTMFSSKVLRKAIEMKALFLQCHCLFHTLSIADVQAVMPPQSGTDYALQLENVVRDLDVLEGVIGTDLFFMFCEKDLPMGEEVMVDIRTVKADLEKRELKCWFSESVARLQIEQLAVAMKNSKLILVFISDDFVLDEGCKRMFKFAKESLRKEMQLVMVGKGREWMKSDFIGIQVTDEVFVNMQRLHQYSGRFEELCGRVQQKLGKQSRPSEEQFDVFLSYAWTNSLVAIDNGQAVGKEGSLGHGDPRVIKDFLQQHGISVWIDVEQVGRMGLYEDIAAGLKQSKIMVACISDEYALSTNCQIEFRFANTSLKKPIILAVVGTGFMWESTEIGMLSLGYPKINFQVANNLCEEQLLRYVQEALDSVEDADLGAGRPLTPSSLTQKEMAFQELFEMAQRKFLRQVTSYVKNSDPYPRLFVADLNYDPTETEDEGEVSLEDTELILDEDTGQKTSFIVDDLRSGQFCIKALCEHEGGWHTVDSGLPIDLSGRDLFTMWRYISPYMARLLAILKHSNINLHIVHTPEGEKLQKHLEQMISTEMQHVDLRPVYLALRSYIMQKDVDNKKGNLSMCYLPSGKTLWLCEEHQKQPRITVLEIPEVDIMPVKDNAELALMSALEVLYQKDTEDIPTDQGGLVKSPSLAPRHSTVKPGRMSEVRAPRKKPSNVSDEIPPKTQGNTSDQTALKTPDTTKPVISNIQKSEAQSQAVEPNGSLTKAPVTPRQTVVQSQAGGGDERPLTAEDRKEMVKRASKQNLSSLMGTGAMGAAVSKDGASQACVIL